MVIDGFFKTGVLCFFFFFGKKQEKVKKVEKNVKKYITYK